MLGMARKKETTSTQNRFKTPSDTDKEGKSDRRVVGEGGDALVSDIQFSDFTFQISKNKNKSQKMKRKLRNSDEDMESFMQSSQFQTIIKDNQCTSNQGCGQEHNRIDKQEATESSEAHGQTSVGEESNDNQCPPVPGKEEENTVSRRRRKKAKKKASTSTFPAKVGCGCGKLMRIDDCIQDKLDPEAMRTAKANYGNIYSINVKEINEESLEATSLKASGWAKAKVREWEEI